MGKSDGPSNTTSTVYNSSLPEYARPYFQNLMSNAEAETNQPYTPYGGQRIQGFTGDQSAAFSGIRNLNAMGNPTVDTAAGMAQNAGLAGMGYSGFQAGNVGTQMFPSANMSAYINPYIDNVLNRQQQRTTDLFNQQQLGRDAAAQQSGAFGGSRQMLQNFLSQKAMNQQLGDQSAQAYSDAWNQGTGLWQGDMSRLLSADQGNQQAQIASANVGLQGAGLGLQGASALGQLGQTQQQLAMDRIKALQGVGQQQQEMGQRSLDQGYQDFINQRDYARNNLGFMSGIMHGIPVSPSSDTITYNPQPNQMSQLLGLGIGGAGLSQLQGSGGTG